MEQRDSDAPLRLAAQLGYERANGEPPVDQDGFGSPFPRALNVLVATCVVSIAVLGAAAGLVLFAAAMLR